MCRITSNTEKDQSKTAPKFMLYLYKCQIIPTMELLMLLFPALTEFISISVVFWMVIFSSKTSFIYMKNIASLSLTYCCFDRKFSYLLYSLVLPFQIFIVKSCHFTHWDESPSFSSYSLGKKEIPFRELLLSNCYIVEKTPEKMISQ